MGGGRDPQASVRAPFRSRAGGVTWMWRRCRTAIRGHVHARRSVKGSVRLPPSFRQLARSRSRRLAASYELRGHRSAVPGGRSGSGTWAQAGCRVAGVPGADRSRRHRPDRLRGVRHRPGQRISAGHIGRTDQPQSHGWAAQRLRDPDLHRDPCRGAVVRRFVRERWATRLVALLRRVGRDDGELRRSCRRRVRPASCSGGFRRPVPACLDSERIRVADHALDPNQTRTCRASQRLSGRAGSGDAAPTVHPVIRGS
jgi:hypothetical protein